MLLLAVLFMTVFLLLAGIGADLARWYVAKEQNQTAVDAASLAGSLHGERHVTIKVQYAHKERRCRTDSDGHRHCRTVCVSDPPVTLTGNEKPLVDEGGWRRGTCDDDFLGIQERWIEFPNDTESISNTIFDLNTPSQLTPRGGGEIDIPSIKAYDSGRYAPSVITKSSGSIKTELLHMIGIDEIAVGNCGQASTFYEVINSGKNQGKNGAPEDGCSD
jgi:hypothetical protein